MEGSAGENPRELPRLLSSLPENMERPECSNLSQQESVDETPSRTTWFIVQNISIVQPSVLSFFEVLTTRSCETPRVLVWINRHCPLFRTTLIDTFVVRGITFADGEPLRPVPFLLA